MNEFQFDKNKHEYTLDGRPLISVTQLMKKHGLSTDYSAVDPEVLSAAAERGALIHREIEEYIKTGEPGFTEECAAFADMAEDMHLSKIESEVMVHNDIVAGTVDIMCMGITKDARTVSILGDCKTTTQLHVDAVRWQLSIYEVLTGREFDELYAFHLVGSKAKAVPVGRVPREEIERLFECERTGQAYIPPKAVIPGDLMERAMAAETAIKEAEAAKKAADEQAKAIRGELMAFMEREGIKSFENDSMKITYIEPTTRVTVDTKKLKEFDRRAYDACQRSTIIPASLRITIRG